MQWILETAKGLQECHECNVIHSDVKAANVLLSSQRHAKLGDLGTGRVIRAASSTLTRRGTATSLGAQGSPLWLAPELVEDSELSASAACDVFSWSILSWEILTCRLPYHDAQDDMQVNLDKLKSKNDLVAGRLRPDLSAVRADAPAALIQLLTRAWSSDPVQRPRIKEIVQQMEALRKAEGY
jgi:serine/threonine protein kinase